MLISFSVENFRSIKDKVTLSLQALPEKNIEVSHFCQHYQNFPLKEKQDKAYDILKSVIIYGLNASGKTNIINALLFFSEFIAQSYERGSKDIQIEPFALDSAAHQSPSTFEAVFLLDGTYFRYGFCVDKKYVHSEWLFASTKGREGRIFFRERDKATADYNFHNSKFRTSHKKVRDNGLLLTVASLDNNHMAQQIVSFFENIRLRYPRSRTLPDAEHRLLLQDIMKSLDIGISSLVYEKVAIDTEYSDTFTQYIAQVPVPATLNNEDVQHIRQELCQRLQKALSEYEELFFSYLDHTGKEILLPEKLQSMGTLIVFSLLAEVLNFHKTPGILLIDEVEDSLHPHLLEYFFKFFHAIPHNKLQLICTTHNALLLDGVFRKDQVYITEKDDTHATDLVSIADFTGVRKNTYMKLYLDGRFGGTPALSDADIPHFVKRLEATQG